MKNFSWALVTGASSGIGESLCHLLASKGIKLLICGRNRVKLEELAESLLSQTTVIPIVADLSEISGRRIVIDKIREYIPDLVINNAGFGIYGEAISIPTASQLDILNVNASAVLEISLEAARTLVLHEKIGTIMNISSVVAFQAFPYSAVYAASKSFVSQFSLAFDFEMQPYGIRVLNACPGMVKTEFNRRAGGETLSMQSSFALSSEYAAEQIWRQIQKGKAMHIFDWKYRMATWLSYLLPRRLVMWFLRSSIASRLTSTRS